MSSAEADFLSAARSFAAGRVENALKVLMPFELAEDELRQRVRHLVAVGAALTGAALTGTTEQSTSGLRPGHGRLEVKPAGVLAAQLVEAGARGDYEAIQGLLATRRPEVLVDILVELLIWFAAWDQSENSRQSFLSGLSAKVPQRDLLARVVALAEETSDLTEDQLRARLVGLHEAVRRLADRS